MVESLAVVALVVGGIIILCAMFDNSNLLNRQENKKVSVPILDSGSSAIGTTESNVSKKQKDIITGKSKNDSRTELQDNNDKKNYMATIYSNETLGPMSFKIPKRWYDNKVNRDGAIWYLCDDMMLMTLYANIEDDLKMGSETSIDNALEDHSRLCNAKCVKILLAVGIFV